MHVLGEFYWVVKAGDPAEVVDFVHPPLMLTRETHRSGDHVVGR